MRLKPFEIAYDPRIVNGRIFGAVKLRTETQELKPIGSFNIVDANWEDFKLLMESVADFHKSSDTFSVE